MAHKLEDELAVAGLPQRRAILLDAAMARAPRRDPLVAAAAARLTWAASRVGEVARELGVSERQLHRRMISAVGYGPKTLSRVLRLRRLWVPATASLAERALAAGYASQAHMSDEVRRLTGRTAVRFLEYPTLTVA
ncbi:MAG: helix-turn-helix domain-containing protein [Actinomycetota bacterium]|nr:helix-turn-helix domain-containing protein [Actinomycetota bacterium]